MTHTIKLNWCSMNIRKLTAGNILRMFRETPFFMFREISLWINVISCAAISQWNTDRTHIIVLVHIGIVFLFLRIVDG